MGSTLLARPDVWLLVLAFIVPPRKTYLAGFICAAVWLLYRHTIGAPQLATLQLVGVLVATVCAAGLVRLHCSRGTVKTKAEKARQRSRSHSFRLKPPSSGPPKPQLGSVSAATPHVVAPPQSAVVQPAEVEMSKKDKAGSASPDEEPSVAGAGEGAGAGSAASAATAAPAAAVDSDPFKVVDVPASELPLGLPMGAPVGGEHCYSTLTGEQFKVRGKNYKSDRLKVSSADAVAELVHVDMFKAPEAVGSLATHPDGYVQKAIAAGDKRFFFVVTFQCPQSPGTTERVHLSLFYALPVKGVDSVGDSSFAKCWRQFTAKGEQGDAYRTARWKVIPSIAEGNWMVRRAVGSKPALLATKLTHEWTVGKQYLDCSVDVASSSMASMLVGLLQSYAKLLVIDLAFVIQGEDSSELPEHVLGTVRLSRPNLEKAVAISR